jgi:uncharacterized Fe-S cluster protein YjdI
MGTASNEEPARSTQPTAKTYEAEPDPATRRGGVAVTFDSAVCRHAAECVRGLPEVFDTGRRPWITPGAADPDQVAEVVRRCPTGALTYRLADGRTEQPDRPTSVTRLADGRLLLRGELRITDGTPGSAARETTRAMLCGCGATTEPPYCDRSGTCGG